MAEDEHLSSAEEANGSTSGLYPRPASKGSATSVAMKPSSSSRSAKSSASAATASNDDFDGNSAPKRKRGRPRATESTAGDGKRAAKPRSRRPTASGNSTSTTARSSRSRANKVGKQKYKEESSVDSESPSVSGKDEEGGSMDGALARVGTVDRKGKGREASWEYSTNGDDDLHPPIRGSQRNLAAMPADAESSASSTFPDEQDSQSEADEGSRASSARAPIGGQARSRNTIKIPSSAYKRRRVVDSGSDEVNSPQLPSFAAAIETAVKEEGEVPYLEVPVADIDGYSSSGTSEVPLLLQAMRRVKAELQDDNDVVSAATSRQQTPSRHPSVEVKDFAGREAEDSVAESVGTSVPPPEVNEPDTVTGSVEGTPAPEMQLGDPLSTNEQPAPAAIKAPPKKRRGRPPKSRANSSSRLGSAAKLTSGTSAGPSPVRAKKVTANFAATNAHREKLLRTLEYERQLINEEQHPLYLETLARLDANRDLRLQQLEKLRQAKARAAASAAQTRENWEWSQWQDKKRATWSDMFRDMVMRQKRLDLEVSDSDYTQVLCPVISCSLPPIPLPMIELSTGAQGAEVADISIVPYDSKVAQRDCWTIDSKDIEQDLELIGLRRPKPRRPTPTPPSRTHSATTSCFLPQAAQITQEIEYNHATYYGAPLKSGKQSPLTGMTLHGGQFPPEMAYPAQMSTVAGVADSLPPTMVPVGVPYKTAINPRNGLPYIVAPPGAEMRKSLSSGASKAEAIVLDDETSPPRSHLPKAPVQDGERRNRMLEEQSQMESSRRGYAVHAKNAPSVSSAHDFKSAQAPILSNAQQKPRHRPSSSHPYYDLDINDPRADPRYGPATSFDQPPPRGVSGEAYPSYAQPQEGRYPSYHPDYPPYPGMEAEYSRLATTKPVYRAQAADPRYPMYDDPYARDSYHSGYERYPQYAAHRPQAGGLKDRPYPTYLPPRDAAYAEEAAAQARSLPAPSAGLSQGMLPPPTPTYGDPAMRFSGYAYPQ